MLILGETGRGAQGQYQNKLSQIKSYQIKSYGIKSNQIKLSQTSASYQQLAIAIAANCNVIAVRFW